MAMLPVFMIGLGVGILITVVYYAYKKSTPSDTKVRIMEATITSLREDVATLEKINEELRSELKQRKKEK